MKTNLLSWSAPVINQFTIRIALDTNLLSYLVDNTYPSMTEFVKKLMQSAFTEQIVGSFVTYEFIGIRKREHFLRRIFDASNPVIVPHKGTAHTSSSINISSLLRYKDSYISPQVNYIDVAKDIIPLIDKEINLLNTQFSIDLNSSTFHSRLLKPTKDLYLNSRISKEDCLVLISTLLPRESDSTSYTCLLTNDDGYETSFKENAFKERIDTVFEDNKLTRPRLEAINKVMNKNLTVKLSSKSIDSMYKNFVLKLLSEQNSNLFIGKTFNENCSGISNVICFVLETDVEIPENSYFTLISKDLKFVANSSAPLKAFRDVTGKPLNSFPITKGSYVGNKFSIQFDYSFDGVNQSEIAKTIKRGGHYLFINPID